MELTNEDLERFWSKVDKSNDCWEWVGGRRNNYGIFRLGEKVVSAHRLSYFLEYGEFSGVVCHACDNPPCVNPKHLFSGSRQDNIDDMYNKGRRQRAKPREKKAYRKAIKISTEQYEEILKALEKPYWGQQNDLAKKYGVSHGTISHIKTGRFVPRTVSLHEKD